MTSTHTLSTKGRSSYPVNAVFLEAQSSTCAATTYTAQAACTARGERLSEDTAWSNLHLRSRVQSFRTGRPAISLYPGIRRERRPPAPRACELPSHRRRQLFPRPPPRRPRTRFLPRSIRRRSPSPRPRRSIIPANLRTAPPIPLLSLGVQMLPPPGSDLVWDLFCQRHSQSSHRSCSCSCRGTSFSPPLFSEGASG